MNNHECLVVDSMAGSSKILIYFDNEQCMKTVMIWRWQPQRFTPSLDDDLQLLSTNVYARRRCDNSLCRTSFGVRFNCPHPTKAAIFVEAPSSATAFPDFHSPIITVGRNCESNCNRSRHNHAAQISNEKCAYHFVSLHFPCSLIEARRHADCFFGRD